MFTGLRRFLGPRFQLVVDVVGSGCSAGRRLTSP